MRGLHVGVIARRTDYLVNDSPQDAQFKRCTTILDHGAFLKQIKTYISCHIAGDWTRQAYIYKPI